MICPNGHESAATDYCDTCGEVMSPTGSSDAAPAGVAGTPPAGAPPSDSSAPVRSPSVDPAASEPCPHCGAPNPPDALFCEACGYDHTTGAVPEPLAPSPFDLDALLVPLPDESPAGRHAAPDPPVPAPAEPVPAAQVEPAPAAGDANPSPSLASGWVVEMWIDPDWYAAQSSPDPLPSPGPPRVVPLRHTSVLVGRTSVSRGITPDLDCGVDNGVSRRHAQLTTDGSRWWIEDLGSSNGTFLADAVEPLPSEPIPVGVKREVGPDDRVYLGSWTRLVIRPAVPGDPDPT